MSDAPFAPGLHLLADFHDCDDLNNLSRIEGALVRAAAAAGASVLGQNFHHFGGAGGVTGVVILAESHISIHTWPETRFAAIDIFMCGDARPHDALSALRADLAPGRVELSEVPRGT